MKAKQKNCILQRLVWQIIEIMFYVCLKWNKSNNRLKSVRYRDLLAAIQMHVLGLNGFLSCQIYVDWNHSFHIYAAKKILLQTGGLGFYWMHLKWNVLSIWLFIYGTRPNIRTFGLVPITCFLLKQYMTVLVILQVWEIADDVESVICFANPANIKNG